MYTNPSSPDYIDTKGIQLVRRDNCPLVKDVSTAILESIMYDKDPQKAIVAAREHLQKVLAGEHPIEKFVVSKALRADYKNTVQPHLTVAKKLHARRGYPPNHGERVPFVYVWEEAADPGLKQSERAECPAWAAEHGLPLDLVYYVDNQLHNPIMTLTEMLVDDAETAIFGWPGVADKLAALRAERESQLKSAKRLKKNASKGQIEITSFFRKA